MKGKIQRLFLALLFISAFSVFVKAETFVAYLSSAQEVPANSSTGTGYARVFVNPATGAFTFRLVFNGLSSNQTASHIHAPAPIGANAGVVINFGAVGGTSGTITGSGTMTPTQLAQIRNHQGYVNVHTANFSGGEIRGQLGINRPVDFDGDGRTDYSVLRFPNVAPPGSAPITYYNLNSTSGFQSVDFGNANTDFPTPGDYDGDGIDDVSLYRAGSGTGSPSFFYLLKSSDNTFQAVQWGTSGDQVVCRDYDGDGKTDFAVYRRGATNTSQAFWYILQSANGLLRAEPWGITGIFGLNSDVPVPGDYDGDGKYDVAVYRWGGLSPNNAFIVLQSSNNQPIITSWGDYTTDYLVPGDYDGDGKTDYAVARTGPAGVNPMTWYILQSSNGQMLARQFGISSDLPTQGDYDGDARTDISVYRRGETVGAPSFFYNLRSLNNSFQATQWGIRGDFPVNTFDSH